MNEDIIKWAREAGIDEFGSLDERLIFFAALVRADEREACAKVCEQEVCTCCWTDEALVAAEHLAQRIRARGQE
jgi:hypothetical protein